MSNLDAEIARNIAAQASLATSAPDSIEEIAAQLTTLRRRYAELDILGTQDESNEAIRAEIVRVDCEAVALEDALCTSEPRTLREVLIVAIVAGSQLTEVDGDWLTGDELASVTGAQARIIAGLERLAGTTAAELGLADYIA